MFLLAVLPYLYFIILYRICLLSKGKQEFLIKKKPPLKGQFDLSNVSNKRISRIIEPSGALS
jgi:hypothetical protein